MKRELAAVDLEPVKSPRGDRLDLAADFAGRSGDEEKVTCFAGYPLLYR